MNIVDLVRFLQDHPEVLPAQIAERLHMSARTLRARISYANEALKGVARIEAVRGFGYRIDVWNAERFDAWLVAGSSETGPLASKTPEERVSYLLNDLLVRTDWIKLRELSDVMFVSKSTLSGDLQQVEKRLASYDLTLEKRSHYGIRVTGSEMSRRLCLVNDAIKASDIEGGAFAGHISGTNALLDRISGGGNSVAPVTF